ncbi:glycosidase [Actinotalea ferrariae CF5-4]|uniref:Alpha-amylase n=1 Tax=Actinotalea ferrariae CF5-4 TaxID=948458 RepID=A0A021VWY7_9CELL|nr:carbohydrate-binding module family 20 domain-containing protein [Actinotalea ferrariae]EYR64530.1 glycosidase [Actinotalea ferrariae CF5-4]
MATTALAAGLTAAPLAAEPAVAATPASKSVTAVMFQWPWTAIARECTNNLGPAGYGYVQTSPPQEHVQGTQWWTNYQPVSYKIESRFGTRAQFASMVQTCKNAGVQVIADVVINHMSGQSAGGTGWAGTVFQHYSYPGTYGSQDFHDCRRDITNYGNAWEVQNCNLVNLADLKTESDYVRGRIAAYMNDLISLGVTGFRVDAAKHIPAADIANIKSRLTNPNVYMVQEVIGAASEPIKDTDYTYISDVHEFDYARELKRVFNGGQLSWLSNFGEAWGLMPSGSAGVFVDNHDTERNGETLNQTYASTYTLANVFMLAWPYGSPSVHSGYSFTNKDAGPPGAGTGTVPAPTCYSNGWRCQHDWREIENMVGFRNATAGAAVGNWWTNGNNQIAFGRGAKGYVVINREGAALSRTFQTSLPAGTYCDVAQGLPTSTGCSGRSITVNASGQFTATVNANTPLALHVNAKAGASTTTPTTQTTISFGVNATTVYGQNVRVVGNHPSLGSWNAAAGVPLSSAAYPVWRAGVAFPAGTRVEYKYVKVDGSGNVVWESGVNRVATAPSTGTLTLNDAWRN